MTTRQRIWTYALWLLVVAAAAAAARAADVAGQVQKNKRDLVRAAVAAPVGGKAAAADLERAVERLRSVRIVPKADPREEPPLVPDLSIPQPPAPAPPPGAEASGGPPAAAISDEVLAQLRKLPPDRIVDPIAVADTLYTGGHAAEAYHFYEMSLKSSGAAEAKAWALFQMANCRRMTDPDAALALYKQVAAEHPKTPWAAVATVQQRLLEWYQTLRPQAAAPKGEKKAGA